jgi:DNA-binding CsgD family transcriptional regulator/tetratricopeptide (TPR) repeat protein
LVIASRGPGRLRGREAECKALRDLVEQTSSDSSAVLVLRGEPGIGKSALLDYLEGEVADCRVLRAAGVESEMELAYAGLHQLCAPLLDGLEALPAPQADALGTAFGLWNGAPPDRFLVGLAVLTLLAEHATGQPVVCLVDDAQWLDRASAECLAFVARRLAADRVLMAFAVRPGVDERTWARLPQLEIGGLDDVSAAGLLQAAVPTVLDERVRNRVLAETRGNPLALLQLAESLSVAELTFGPGWTLGAGVTDQMEERFRRDVAELPAETRLLLLVAAAEPLGDRALLRAASERLGIDPEAAIPAEAAGLFEARTAVRFRHPLVRSAVYRSAELGDRQRAHRALADVTDPDRDPDRRAWHLAHAASGPDEAVAAELERSADRALAHGGLAAAAAFLEQAALLTLDEPARADRELAAAETALGAGLLDDVMQLLAVLEDRPLTDLQRARCELLRAQIAFASERGGDAVFLLMAAADRLAALLPELACDTYVTALQASMFVGRLAREPGVVGVARAARKAPVTPPPRRGDQLMLSIAALLEDGLAAAAPLLRRGYEPFLAEELPVEEALRLLVLAEVAAYSLWDLAAWTSMSDRLLQLARETGALVTLQLALTADAYARLFNGDLVTAEAHLDEAAVLAEVSGIPVQPYAAIAMAGLRGDPEGAETVITPAERDAVARAEGLVVCLSKWSWAMVCNGNGRYAEALAHCRELLSASDGKLTLEPFELAPNAWALAELVEAAVRCDEPATATVAADLLSDVADVCSTDWALGVAARSQALLRDGDEADDLYRESIERLGRGGVHVEHARALLLYGEWLRRAGRRSAAREILRQAHDSFVAMRIQAFAERTRRELSATGEQVRRQVVDKPRELTPQELHIARLAADGRSNPEIGAELYLSRHTVEWHLKKVFAKLDVTSRHQLRDALGASAV